MAIKIDVTKDVTQRLKFEPSKAHGMYCIGKLESVELSSVEIKADADWEFKGMTIPRLAFHFVNHKIDPNDPDRYFTHSELPIAIVKKDGAPAKYASMLTELWNRLKHIHDAYKGTPNYRPIQPGDIPDFSDDITSDPAVRIKEFEAFFTYMFNSFKGTGDQKPIWLDVNGVSVPQTMKLIATDGEKSQYLAFPKFVGTGFIQPFKLKGTALDTTLSFRGSETSVLTSTTPVLAPGATQEGGIDPNLPEDVRNALLNRKVN